MRESKPLLVPSPVVIPIDPTTIRFEWMYPLTYCSISKFVLSFIVSENSSSWSIATKFSTEIPITNASQKISSIVLNTFRPFTTYLVSITACINSASSGLCTTSYEKSFQTPGTIPQGLSIPHVKQVLFKAVSIEWQPPIFPNGLRISYQISRNNLELNKTETIYSGNNLFFLDTSFLKI